MLRSAAVMLLWLLVVAPSIRMSAQAPTRTIADGVYSEEQATRGERVYRQTCTLCHGSRLLGSENGPELLGEPFLKSWYGRTVGDLFVETQQNMPKDDPATLSSQQVADVLAFIFRANGFPAGADALPGQERPLKAIAIPRTSQP
jgi:mono/diheme cytochrome c family protein